MARAKQTLCLLAFTLLTFTQNGFCQDLDGAVTVDLTARMTSHGREKLAKNQFFNTNGSNLSDPLSDMLKGMGFWPGRVNLDYNHIKVTEDPNHPGYADPSFYDTSLKINDSLLSLGGGMPNFFTLVMPIYSCPAFMQVPGMPNTPKNYEAMSQIAVAALLNIEKYGILPDYFELWNEPNLSTQWGWMGKGSSDGWSTFSDYCDEIIPMLRLAIRDLKIAGPVDEDVLNWPLNSFKNWSYRKAFMDKFGPALDLFSYHFYGMNSSQFNASLDLICNYSQYTFKSIKPLLISEYGGNPGDETESPINFWSILHSGCEEMILCLNHPHVEKAIPFFLPTAVGFDPNFVWQLFDRNGPTPLYNFVNLWQPVSGYYLFSSSNIDSIVCTAFLDDSDLQTVYLALSNTTNQNISVGVNFRGNGDVSKVKASKLFWDGTHPALNTESILLDEPLEFSPNECKVLTILLASPLEDLPVVNEEMYYSGIYFAPIVSSVTTPIELPDNVTNAVLRYCAQRPENADQIPEITFNGHALPAGDGPVGGKNNFGSSQIEIPSAYLKKKNFVTIRYRKSGGYLVSIGILATAKVEEE